MQVTSLFATIFAFLALVAPLATQALQINSPTSLTPGNTTITFTTDSSEAVGPLQFLLVENNGTRDATLATGIASNAGSVTVDIPANVSGTGWTIEAWMNQHKLGQSALFSVTSPTDSQGMSHAGEVVGGVVGAVIGVALIVLAVFIYTRRRHHQLAATGTTFNLEAGFPPPRPRHERSFSSTSGGSVDGGNKLLEMEKIQWEMELEGQFARARACTPDIPRGFSPLPRASPPRNVALPLAPQRAVTRDTNY
ncbi:hypothetical protein DFH07DRAFT_864021 [Mycena maculata]|uniref:Uncharacterized protein n=1 Tax=Mycena maculata TaxID=230809 RepID=A0AAD7MEA4_9AGAR|nr:hypothetical protein DFH07DRAFT_864021 [Mycena maculata]